MSRIWSMGYEVLNGDSDTEREAEKEFQEKEIKFKFEDGINRVCRINIALAVFIFGTILVEIIL